MSCSVLADIRFAGKKLSFASIQKAAKGCFGDFSYAVLEGHVYTAAPDSAVVGEFNTFSVKDVVNAKVCAAMIVDLLINDKV